MKNIEKYTNTKDALEAYNSLASKPIPFDKWLESEYEEPRVPTLLEAAKEMTGALFAGLPDGSFPRIANAIKLLCTAVEREDNKPVRKCDKYRTAEEAQVAFAEFCGKNKCGSCRCGDSTKTAGCALEWLYEEAGKEETK